MNTWPRPCAALAAAALLLAGCGGSGETAEPGAGDTQTFRVADTNGVPLYFLKYGDQQGFFEEAGVDLEITASSGGATIIPQLVSGDIDVAGSNVVSALIAAGKGLPIQMVAAGTSTSEDPEQDFSALMVPGNSPVKDISQLEGKQIAVNSLRNINDIVLGSMLEEAGLSYGSVQFVEIPFPDMAAAVQRKDVAAAMLIEPFITPAEEAGMKIVGRPYTDLRPGLQIGTYLMTEQTVAENPEAMQAFQQGVQATADSIAENPAGFREALPKVGEVEPELAQEIRISIWRGKTDRESLRLIQELMVEYGLIENKVNLDDVVVG